MRIVVDACVAVKWFVPEEQSELAHKLLGGEYDLHAPELLIPEFANILRKKCRNKEIKEEEAKQILHVFETIPIRYHSHQLFIQSAFEASIITGATVYDCTYLILADWLDCRLVTADQRFYRATAKYKVAVPLEDL